MLADMAGTVLRWVGSFFVFMFLLRFYFQLLRAPFRNQAGAFVVATTNWAVVPARRVVPSVFGLDLASWLLAWVGEALVLTALQLLKGNDLSSAPGIAAAMLFAIALLNLVRYSLEILMFVLIFQALLSWLNPHHPIQDVLDVLSRPFLRPIRRFVKPVANIDLSPAILILVVVLILTYPMTTLQTLVAGLF